MSKKNLKIVHVITGLNTGGAEIMLWRLLGAMKNQNKITNIVVCMGYPGPLAERIRELDVPLYSLEMQPGKIAPVDILHLAQFLKREKPDLVQTWMYHADFVGGLAARLAGNFPTVWGIHNSSVEIGMIKKSTLLIIKLCAALSAWLPAKIISCSQYAQGIHIGAGYKAEKFIFIPNGFDTQAFQPRPSAHAALCNILDIPENIQIVGLVARFNPQKDIENFIKAAIIVMKSAPDVHFVLCGDDMTASNKELSDWITSGSMQDSMHLLGRRNDIPNIIAGFDIAALSSASEAFPLVLGEAMASGIPCVSTDVGDSAYLIGDTGQIVSPRNAQALATGIINLLSLSENQRKALGEKARQRICDNFSLEKMAFTYSQLYERFALQAHKKSS